MFVAISGLYTRQCSESRAHYKKQVMNTQNKANQMMHLYTENNWTAKWTLNLQKIIDLRVTFWKNCTWALNHCMHTDRCSSLKNSNISLLYLSLTNCSSSKLFNLSLQINNSKKSISLTKTIKQRKIWYKGSQLWAILFNRSSLLIILCRNKVWVVAILIGPNSLRIYCIRPKCGLLWF